MGARYVSLVSGKDCWDLLSNCKLQSGMGCMQTPCSVYRVLRDVENFMFMGPCIIIYEEHINKQQDATVFVLYW
jgi:hypothetical protein